MRICLITFLTFIIIMIGTAANSILNNKTIIFNSDHNVFAFKGTVNEDLKDRFIEKVINSKGRKFYIYFDSPGGSVHALNNIVDFMQASKKHYICVARFAASAAFMTFEHCQERLMMRGGILMSHNASSMISGELPRIASKLRLWTNLIEAIEKRIAKRMKMTFKKYKKLINVELWLDISDAKRYNAIDDVVYATCSKKLMNKKVTTTSTRCSLFTGCKKVTTTVSACPILNKVYK